MKEYNAWNSYNEQDLAALEKLSRDYIDFLSEGKTERECTELLVKMAQDAGYRDLEDIIKNGEKIAQMVLCPVQHEGLVNVMYVPEINIDTERGTGGFGHTGV